MATSKRPGQIRFEAWVPEDLFNEFNRRHKGGRKAWLVAAMRADLNGAPKPRTKPADTR